MIADVVLLLAVQVSAQQPRECHVRVSAACLTALPRLAQPRGRLEKVLCASLVLYCRQTLIPAVLICCAAELLEIFYWSTGQSATCFVA